MKPKIAFATCVQLGLSCIEEIDRLGGTLDLLITLKDNKGVDKSGRVYLDQFAALTKTPLLKINNINDSIVTQTLRRESIDWLFIIGWSQIAGANVLNAPLQGCIGMHPTLLPMGRGRAAIPWSIIKGLDETGVTMFKLNEGVDTGPIISQVKIPINSETTATDLYGKVNSAHIQLIRENWSKIATGKIELIEQDEALATVWPGRKPEDGKIDSKMSMEEADRLVRAVTHPYPGAYFCDEDKIIRIWSAEFDKYKGPIKLADGYLTPINFELEDKK